jgi:hypothetical protein
MVERHSMKTWWPLSALLVALGVPATSFATPGLAGHYACGVTDYMWPSAPDDTPTVTGNGSVEFESAGNGKFLSGTMSERVADDTHRFGERLCTFQMVKGDYHFSSPRSGTATISWKLNSGSDSHCGAYLRNLPNLGFTESASDYDVFAATTQFFLYEDGSTKWIGASAVGIQVGVCRPAR